MRLSILSIVIAMIVSSNCFSKNKEFPLAKVTKLKGVVTVLAPHSKEAKKLVSGDFLMEESSVVTEEKSFAKIQFNDGSIVSVGPNSKIVIEPVGTEKGSTLLNLLKGQLRAKVESENKNAKNLKSKFFIKTRTAALGVRGTEFQAMYQPDAMRTGLLTFKGEVAIKKIEPGELAKKVEVVAEKRVHAFRQALDADVKEVKVAKLGDYTNLSAIDPAPSAPVKIDPTQLTLLKRDESMGVEKVVVNMKEAQAEALKIGEQYKKEGITKSMVSEIKPLGLIDTKSGFYIPPRDDKANTEIGQIAKNGQYVAPKGLEIDPNKGFVAKVADDKDAQAKIGKMNALIENQTVPDKDNPYYKRYFDTGEE